MNLLAHTAAAKALRRHVVDSARAQAALAQALLTGEHPVGVCAICGRDAAQTPCTPCYTVRTPAARARAVRTHRVARVVAVRELHTSASRDGYVLADTPALWWACVACAVHRLDLPRYG